MSHRRPSSGPPEEPTPVCRCRVLYLGSAVPHASKDGLQGIQGPLSQLYPAEGLAGAKGIDSWLSVWSNGLLLENVDEQQHKVTRFFPIEALHYCAAVRYVLLPTPAGQPLPRFLPLDAPPARFPNPAHPPLFAAILRRTSGLKVLECHVFMCRRETPANALVRCCFHVYADAEQARRLNGGLYGAICGARPESGAPAETPQWSEEEARLDLEERNDDNGENGAGVELGEESDDDDEPSPTPAERPGSREQLMIDVGDGEGGPVGGGGGGRQSWREETPTDTPADSALPLYATARRNRPRQRQRPAAPPPPPSPPPPPPPPSAGRQLPPGPDWDEPDRGGRSVSGSPGAWQDRAAMRAGWESAGDRESSIERTGRSPATRSSSSRRRNLGPPPPPPQRQSLPPTPSGYGPMSSLSLPRPGRGGPRPVGDEQLFGPYGGPLEPPGYATVGRPQYATLGRLRSRKASPPGQMPHGPPVPPGMPGIPLPPGMTGGPGMPGPGLRRLQPHEQRAFGFSLEHEQRSRSHGNLLQPDSDGRPVSRDAARNGRDLHQMMTDMDVKERKEQRPRRSIFASLRRS